MIIIQKNKKDKKLQINLARGIPSFDPPHKWGRNAGYNIHYFEIIDRICSGMYAKTCRALWEGATSSRSEGLGEVPSTAGASTRRLLERVMSPTS